MQGKSITIIWHVLVHTLLWSLISGEITGPVIWDIVGPFPFAYRELGADPLQAFGGINSIPRADASSYPSELVNGGRAGWSKANSSQSGTVSISFSNIVNWDLLGNGVGPSGQLWQGWALGDFVVDKSDTYLVQCVDNDFTQTFTQSMIWIDEVILNGNTVAYTFPWYPIHLEAGTHTLKLKISGGGDSESFSCRFSNASISSPFVIIENDDTVPDVVDGVLASPFVSIPILNTQNSSFLSGVTVSIVGQNFSASFDNISIAPSQILPITIDLSSFKNTPICPSWSLLFQICAESFCVEHNVTMECQTFPQPYKFTFLDYDGAVHYAALVPPNTTCPQDGCSILLTVHGCGVRAESGAWTGSYQPQKSSWILLPTGRREVGFDWEGPGTLNVLSALEYLMQILIQYYGVPSAQVSSLQPDPTRIIFAGHSMGGHGTLNFAGHFPDLAIGVAPAAGWIKWEYYVPYFTRIGDSLADPYLLSLLYASIAEHDADFYTPNMVGLPFIVRMGGDDETVPPWNLRRMSRMIDQLTVDSQAVEISEVPGQGHWWGGVVDDSIMQSFFDRVEGNVPQFSSQFSIVSMNPATFAGKGGIKILQHLIPYRAARIEVVVQQSQQWQLETENLRRFTISSLPSNRNLSLPSQQLVIDGQTFSFSASSPFPALPSHFCNLDGSAWKICSDDWASAERGPSNYGPVRQVIEGPVLIVYGSSGTDEEETLFQRTGVWLANDLYHTGRFAIQVLRDSELTPDMATQYNLILLGGPSQNMWASKLESSFPMKFTSGGYQVGPKTYSSPHTGSIFLAPWSQNERLVVVVSGNDDVGYWNAFQSFPTHTGHMVPDYLVVGPKFGWAGAGGLLAAGFWNNLWAFDVSCGYVK